MTNSDPYLLYIGTYTSRMNSDSKGIYCYRFDSTSGELTAAGTTSGIHNPAYLSIDAKRGFLYAVNEDIHEEDAERGGVSAFKVDSSTGALTFLNRQSSRGRGPCYVWAEPGGRYVLVANYPSGDAAVLPVGDEGYLGESTDYVKHEGSGPNEKRQEAPHAHCVVTDPENRYAFVVDLGIDRVMIYRLDHETGDLAEHGWVETAPGAGPRHLTFHPNGKYAFVVNELDSSVLALAYDAEQGTLTPVGTVSTLPDDFEGENTCAAIHVHPSGRYVYASNRGHDSVAVLEFDADTGRLTAVGYDKTQGQTPRDFTIDPSGQFLLAAHQDSNDIVTFRIDQQSGRLEPTGQVIHVPAPVCLKWYI